mmetsp:Transcript_96342/g.299506  ORF Transcript_96342/g.299506 Transcript_96342/m.299506 type:complete len:408 (+) Transcript_96342:141-1364(+)
MEDGCRYDSLRRLDAQQATAAEFEQLESEGRPFLLVNVVGPDFAAWWCGEVLKKLGPASVYFMEGDGATGQRTVMQGSFEVFARECGSLSDRERFAYLQSELLPERTPELVERLQQNLPGPLPAGAGDLFGRWPQGLRPAPLSLTVAGTGARTQLGLDGLMAGQWHLCLVGHERLKLLPDERQRLGALRPASEAFGIHDEQGRPVFDVCRHLTSDLDLFAAELVDYSPATHLDAFGPDLGRWPDARLLPRALEVLLRPGELLVLPGGGWWMQCYFDEPSWVVSSQYLNPACLDRVLDGMLEHSGVSPESIFALSSMPPEQRVDAVLAAVLGSKGRGDGRVLLERLRQLGTRKAGGAGDGEGEAGPSCEVCGRPARTKCGRCKGLWLCGAECQRRSWPEHKKVCVRAR